MPRQAFYHLATSTAQVAFLSGRVTAYSPCLQALILQQHQNAEPLKPSVLIRWSPEDMYILAPQKFFVYFCFSLYLFEKQSGYVT
jgi:hypothetical protein